jgi:hypothetical protein
VFLEPTDGMLPVAIAWADWNDSQAPGSVVLLDINAGETPGSVADKRSGEIDGFESSSARAGGRRW